MPRYVDYAEYYDYDYPLQEEEIRFYLEYAVKTGGPILELACGTGRITVPVAEAGLAVHGVDISENMLAVARGKIMERDLSRRVTLTLSDMANFSLGEGGFAMAFIAARSFMHLFTQEKQLSCLGSVYRHLRPGGLFLMDLYSPNFKRLSQPPEAEYRIHREFSLPNGNRVVHKRRFRGVDLVNQINSEEILFEEYSPEGRLIRTKSVPMETRYTFRYELELLLEKTGFRIQSLFRNFSKEPYEGTGKIIVVATKEK